MLVLTYSYRIYPDLEQELQMLNWLETCRKVYNYAVGERKDWINSRKCPVNACSLQKEYLIPAATPYPDYYRQKQALTEAKKSNPELKAVHSQVLQDVIGRVDAAFVAFQQKRTGFPRFKKLGRMRSFLFPQMKGEAIDGRCIKLPKIGQVSINLHRPIPEGFDLKAVRVVRKHSGWYVMLTLKADVDVPDIPPEGHALGLDVGLEYFLCTSDGEQVSRLRGTSQACPDCGAEVHKELKDRTHHCSECGSIKPRDVASGQVIRNRGLSAVGLTTDQAISGRDLPGALPRQDRTKEIVAGAIQ